MNAKISRPDKKKKSILIFAVCIVGCIVLVSFIMAAYTFGWPWTGFSAETSEPKQQAKTLWDWLQLLAAWLIPVAIALFSLRYSKLQNQTENRIAIGNRQESALQAYLDRMSELLLDKGLSTSDPDSEVRHIARARTLTALAKLDPSRQESLIQFLYESKLISIIDLSGAKISEIDLRWATIVNANLMYVDLSKADLREANLNSTKLCKANLKFANLTNARLTNVDFTGADLTSAILTGADLTEAIFTDAIVDNTQVSKEQKEQLAKSKSSENPNQESNKTAS